MTVDRDLDDIAKQFADVFASSWNAQDGAAYGDAYWADAELVDPTGTIWQGREAIAAMHVDLWKGPAYGTRVSAEVRRLLSLSDTLAILDLDIKVTGFSPPPPGAAVDEHGALAARLKHVIQKRGSEWKILASQNTFVAAAPPG